MADLLARLEQELTKEVAVVDGAAIRRWGGGILTAETVEVYRADQVLALCRAWQAEQDKLLPSANDMLGIVKPCKWTEDEIDGSYDTDCGHVFTFETDGPTANGGRFCFYCGQPLEEVRCVAPPPATAEE